ncbi:cob(I)yrinic acid a,c-diamide adenosyltransferase [Alicyclobacillus curvatus]|nr:cob(I)yrinic acid a,c-diamide adenosyltransferase [Alicyclobacillus curvatus]
MKIYTRGGDAGQTSLIYGRRIRKDDLQVEAYGNVDEANSCLGFALSLLPADDKHNDLRRMCQRIQRDLFDVGRDLATPSDKREDTYISAEDVKLLEQMIDTLDAENAPLTQFILPGGHPAGAALHLARTVTRRAERSLVRLQGASVAQPEVVKYLNRLSDFLFVAARVVNGRMGVPEDAVNFSGKKFHPMRSGDEHDA